MKQYLPDLIGLSGYVLLTAGLYVQFGAGISLILAGGLAMFGAYFGGLH